MALQIRLPFLDPNSILTEVPQNLGARGISVCHLVHAEVHETRQRTNPAERSWWPACETSTQETEAGEL